MLPKTCIQLFQRYREIAVFQYAGERINRMKQHQMDFRNVVQTSSSMYR
jgi:hypothetical protein